MCKTQDTINERRDHSGHELHLRNMSNHRTVVCSLKQDLGRPIKTKQGFMMSPLYMSVYCSTHRCYRIPSFVYSVNAEKMKALYCDSV